MPLTEVACINYCQALQGNGAAGKNWSRSRLGPLLQLLSSSPAPPTTAVLDEVARVLTEKRFFERSVEAKYGAILENLADYCLDVYTDDRNAARRVQATRAQARLHWRNAIAKARQIAAYSFPGSLAMTPAYYLERLDPRHMCGPQHAAEVQAWTQSGSGQPYLDWLNQKRGPNAGGVMMLTKFQRNHHYAELQESNSVQVTPWFAQNFLQPIPDGQVVELIFVVDQASTLYVGIKQRGSFQHSSFLAGKPAMNAGSMTINPRNGFIYKVTNASGHYGPSQEKMLDFMDMMRAKGIDLNLMEAAMWDGYKWAFDGNAGAFYAQFSASRLAAR